MGRTKKVGITGKFGSRYGLRIRRRILDVEAKKSKECPFCGKKQLKRIAAGIWECKKCKNKFAGGTHIPKMV
ncbi:MAG: 50S ribosomal protein L37Ae [Candidatus Aenigmarchaeota archaeon]|nr:50S ribosomal protein L37Ae [Candidatus Aenigmarchaeota archaeon]